MKFSVITLFPEILSGYLQTSIMAKAVARGHIGWDLINLRPFGTGTHRNCDDTPFGGGAGMVLKPEPLEAALQTVLPGGQKPAGTKVVFPTPSGRVFDQQAAQELAGESHLVFICGRYEGIDQRIIDQWVDAEYSIGDYVISSGEVSSLVIMDAVYRLVDEVISADSLQEESFSNGLLEYPQYTRPANFNGHSVPDVLLSGNHAEIVAWRQEQRIRKTGMNRPDLLKRYREETE
ncbi:MAG: tRNA (guanosine(37)-N1)-methyltransferase TrmD [Spirochaetaceae bacterium]|nr:MAG: tRNA (guanosine(37)-N1)-methyltransferase TrmD [Spirochaetaceae bacterium]